MIPTNLPTNVTIKAGLVCADCPRVLLTLIGISIGIAVATMFWAAYQMYKDRKLYE